MGKRSAALFGRRTAGITVLFAAAALIVSACSSGSVETVTVTVPSSQAQAQPTVAAPELTSAGSSAPSTAESSSTQTVAGSNVRITAKPAFGSKNVPPNDPVTITVFAATLGDVTLKGNDGRVIAGKIASDKGSWTSTQRMAYNTTYTFTGTATSADGKTTKISGKISTVNPKSTERASIQIPDGATVGVGAPIIITFSGKVTNRAAAEKALTVTTSAGSAVQGNWAWMQDEQIQANGPVQSQVHWRPTKSPVTGATPFWPKDTKVTVQANLRGVDLGDGQWGRADFTSGFTVGRSQIVIANASTHRLIITVDGLVTKNYAVSYGKESVPGRATVTGIHLVTEKYPTFKMCNPQFDYCNALEKWAVRINNNGEFIHENLKAAAAFGIANVSHGCINMGEPDAQDYYNSAIYGDPVVVTNTGGPAMSEKDAVYDWIYSPTDWQALSAL
ncbi:Lipoprotein-anchoring transpeptidase ErfK/SrfK [Nakamurella panacisegetis]|uniref:Lipoprotein-anchoring transpeptidase ErfK/SrfK n=1 Tax=Nakamurella panacisegetis TaxID=1090615 RepID=A0A1H0JG31_9ACTN|nr:Ig-like domain-containing protein [Nakamurella panacisegetis]SDO42728.1 Lipoprotein-anchoring transpeptidase ErfK/SrfK [Nakamurella panacisegetis]